MADETEEVKPVEELKVTGGQYIVVLQDHISLTGDFTIEKNTVGKLITGGEKAYKDREWVVKVDGIESYFKSTKDFFREASENEIKYYKEIYSVKKQKLIKLPIFVKGEIVCNPEDAYTTNWSKKLKPNTQVVVDDSITAADPYKSIFFVEGHPDAYRMMDFILCTDPTLESIPAREESDPVSQAMKFLEDL